MKKGYKTVAFVKTKEGMDVKVWVNHRTQTVLPTNWKQQCGFLHDGYKSQRHPKDIPVALERAMKARPV